MICITAKIISIIATYFERWATTKRIIPKISSTNGLMLEEKL